MVHYRQGVLLLFGIGVLTVAFVALSGCAQKKQRPGSDGGSGITPGESVAPPSIFPHPDDWVTPSSHGIWVNRYGQPPCLNCHSVDENNGSTSACHSCHPLYPHENEWNLPSHHGPAGLSEGGNSCRTQCHGYDLQGGLSKISCNSCHEAYPHSLIWVLPTQHGAAAKGDGKISCRSCHGEDLSGGRSGVGCRQCHSNYPHDAGWENREQHGSFAQANGEGPCATQCHGADLQGGLSGVACNACHEIYPHPPQWNQGHQTAVQQKGLDVCRGCHGNDLQRILDGKNCFSCHPTYPHSAGWNLPSAHGVAAYGAGKNSCKTANCHGANFGGSHSCFEAACHADFPHLNPAWVNGPSSVHASTFINRINSGDATACQECHGAGYDRNVGGTQCTACHLLGVTHTAAWPAGTGHGTYYAVTRNFDSTSEPFCKDCHGNPTLAVNFAVINTKAGLAAKSDCYGCHWAYPHVGYDVAGYDPGTAGVVDGDELWGIVDDNILWGPGDNLGHVYYLMGTPLFTDSGGHYPSHTNDPILIGPMPPAHAGEIPALPYTCGGGTANNCHFGGYRTTPTGSTSNLCGKYCHKPGP